MSAEGITFTLPAEFVDELARRVAAQVEVAAQDAPTWLTIGEAADHTRIPKNTLYKLTARGAVPHYKPGSRLLFRRDELDAWIDEFREGHWSRLAVGNGRAT